MSPVTSSPGRWLAPVASAGMLLSAFAPLTVTIAIVSAPFADWWWNAALAIACFLPVLVLVGVLRAVRGIGATRIEAKKVRRRDSENLSLISSFILPTSVAMFAPDDTRTPASLVVLVLLMIIYVRAGLQYLNPLLIVVGYHVYSVERDNGAEVFVLSRAAHVAQDAVIHAYQYSDNVYIDRGDG